MSKETESQTTSESLRPSVPVSPLFVRAWARMYGLDPTAVEADIELKRACVHDWQMYLLLQSIEGGER